MSIKYNPTMIEEHMTRVWSHVNSLWPVRDVDWYLGTLSCVKEVAESHKILKNAPLELLTDLNSRYSAIMRRFFARDSKRAHKTAYAYQDFCSMLQYYIFER